MRPNQTYEALARSFAVGRKLDLLDVQGQSIFPIYAASGGLAAKFIFYFRAPGRTLPLNGEDLGLEEKHHPSVWPVELAYDATLEECVEHIDQRIAAEELAAEREANLGVSP